MFYAHAHTNAPLFGRHLDVRMASQHKVQATFLLIHPNDTLLECANAPLPGRGGRGGRGETRGTPRSGPGWPFSAVVAHLSTLEKGASSGCLTSSGIGLPETL